MTDVWVTIELNEPRMWEFYDQGGRWFGRGTSESVEAAFVEAKSWLDHSAEFTFSRGYETRVTVRCLATDERASAKLRVQGYETKR